MRIIYMETWGRIIILVVVSSLGVSNNISSNTATSLRVLLVCYLFLLEI